MVEREKKKMSRVVIESPYGSDNEEVIKRNERYARACMNDSLKRGEAPFASHLLYTQPGILRDNIPDERRRGIEAGFAWGECAELSCVYVDLGISSGMQLGIEKAKKAGRKVEFRSIPDWETTTY